MRLSMLSVKEEQLAWLQRFLYINKPTWRDAEYIMGRLEWIGQEYWLKREVADRETHVAEIYDKGN